MNQKNPAKEKVSRKTHNTTRLNASEIKTEPILHKAMLKIQNEELLSKQSLLIKSIENYIALFEFAPVGYFIIDKKGIILNVNQMGSTIFRTEKTMMIGTYLSGFFNSDETQEQFYLHRQFVRETGLRQQDEFEIKRKDGTIFTALIESTAIKEENNHFKFYLTAISDITIQKQQERLLELSLTKERELNEMKSRFITIATHEFMTPLATILSSVELIEKYTDSVEHIKKKDHYRKIKNSVYRLKEILIDFLSASELENGDIKNTPENFDIKLFIEKILEEVLSFDGIHTLKYRHSGTDKIVNMDKKILKTCLSNLIINAFKFSPKGGTIIITTNTKDRNLLDISIQDHGIGIPKEEQGDIFKSFFRAKNTIHIQGTGLGLNITQKLIALMGGNISFQSEENKGTTFFLKFPRQ